MGIQKGRLACYIMLGVFHFWGEGWFLLTKAGHRSHGKQYRQVNRAPMRDRRAEELCHHSKGNGAEGSRYSSRAGTKVRKLNKYAYAAG